MLMTQPLLPTPRVELKQPKSHKTFLMQCTKMSKGPVMCNVKQTTLGPANEQLQCALAAIQAEQKTICRP